MLMAGTCTAHPRFTEVLSSCFLSRHKVFHLKVGPAGHIVMEQAYPGLVLACYSLDESKQVDRTGVLVSCATRDVLKVAKQCHQRTQPDLGLPSSSMASCRASTSSIECQSALLACDTEPFIVNFPRRKTSCPDLARKPRSCSETQVLLRLVLGKLFVPDPSPLPEAYRPPNPVWNGSYRR